MSQSSDPYAAIREIWPEFDEYLKLPDAEQEALVLKHWNEARATIGGPPLDHLPTSAEVARKREIREAEYRQKYYSLPNRLRRAWASLLGQD